MSPVPLGVLGSALHVAGGGGGVPVTYIGGAGSLTDVPIGTADADRIVLIAYCSECYAASGSPTVTIGGVTATVDHVGYTYSEAEYLPYTVVAHAAVPTGTTATVTVTEVGVIDRGRQIVVWTVTAADLTATDTASAVNYNSTPTTITVTAPSSGLVLGVVNSDITDLSVAVAWTGLDETHEYSGGNRYTSSGVAQPAAGDLDVTATQSASYWEERLDVVAFQVTP